MIWICRKYILVFAFASFLIPARAQNQNLEVVGQIGGDCLMAEPVGNLAYIGEGTNLTILDISNPSTPTPVGKIRLSGLVRTIAFRNNIAYVGQRQHGIDILDVQDPTSPVLKGSIAMPYAEDLATSGNLLYVAANDEGLLIFDTTNATSPVLRGQLKQWAHRLALTATHAYVISYFDGLQAVDIRNPASPQLRSTYPIRFSSVTVDGGYAYLAGESGFHIVSLANPDVPTRVGVDPWRAYLASGTIVSGNRAWVACGPLIVYDISNRSNPRVIAESAEIFSGTSVAGTPQMTCIGDSMRGALFYKLDEATTPRLMATYYTQTVLFHLLPDNDRVYLGGEDFHIIDVSQPNRPSAVGYQDSYVYTGMASSGTLLYAAEAWGDLHILDVADPRHIRTVGLYPQRPEVLRPAAVPLENIFPSDEHFSKIQLDGRYCYISEHGSLGALRILDLANPSSPVTVQQYSRHIWDFRVDRSVAFICSETDGLMMLNVRNPKSPRLLRRYQSSAGFPSRIHLNGRLAFVGFRGNQASLEALDVRDPANPVLLARYQTAGKIHGISSLGKLAVIVTSEAEVPGGGHAASPGASSGRTLSNSAPHVGCCVPRWPDLRNRRRCGPLDSSL